MRFFNNFWFTANASSVWAVLFFGFFVGCPDILANQNAIKNFISSTPGISKIKITKTNFEDMPNGEVRLVSATFEAAWKEGSFVIKSLSVDDNGYEDSFGRHNGKYWFFDGASQVLRVYMDVGKGSDKGLEQSDTGRLIGENDLFAVLLLGILGAAPGAIYWDESVFNSSDEQELSGRISTFEDELVTGLTYTFQGLVVDLKYEYDRGLKFSGAWFPKKIAQIMKTPNDDELGGIEYEIEDLILWEEKGAGPELNPEVVYQHSKIVWESSKGTKYKNAGDKKVFELGVGDPGSETVWIILGIGGPAVGVLVVTFVLFKKRVSASHHGQSETT